MSEPLMIAVNPVDIVDRLRTEAHRATEREQHELAHVLKLGAETIVELMAQRPRSRP